MQCCNNNCNQGRDCPYRHARRFADLTWKHWVLIGVITVAMVVCL